MSTRRFVQSFSQLVTGELTERLEQCDVEISPDHRDRDEHSLRRLAQPLDPPADEAAHALRKLEVFFRVARLRTRTSEHALRLRHIEERVLDEERVALGRRLDAQQLNGGQRSLGHARDDSFHIVVGEPAQSNPLRSTPLQESRKRRGKRSGRVQLRVPVGAQDDHPASVHSLREVPEEHDGRFIGPLQVVQHDQQRFGALHAVQECVRCFEQLLANLVGPDRGRDRHGADLLAKGRCEVCEQRAVVAGRLLQRLRGSRPDSSGQHIPERPIRFAIFLEAAPAQDEPSLGGRFARDLGGETRCADAWGAGQKDDRSAACGSPVERNPDVEPLLLSVDKTIAGGEHAMRFLHLARRDLVQPPSVGESLELVAAAKIEFHLGNRAHQLADDLRDEDLAAFRFARDSSRDVHRGAEDVTGFLNDLTRIETDANPQLALGILLAVVADGLLDVERAFDAMPG